jgi:hypothetical protein
MKERLVDLVEEFGTADHEKSKLEKSKLLSSADPPPTPGGIRHLCQHCRHGMMRVVEILSPTQVSAWLDAPQPENSS